MGTSVRPGRISGFSLQQGMPDNDAVTYNSIPFLVIENRNYH